jgi:DNA polymerase-4
MAVDWLFLDMNAFFASVEQQERPELRGRPVAVVPLLSDSTCVIAASYQAKAFGIKTGTNVGEARRLCPNLVLVEARHRPYREYHRRIVEVVEQCIPITHVLSIDEMYCRLWENERSLQKAVDLGRAIKAEIRKQVGECLTCSVGLGPNPFMAKMAAEMQKPDGLVTITQADLPEKLFRLSLRDFPGIGRRMESRLNAAGVYTTEQMYALSKSQMRAIWGGVGGEAWWRLLRGEAVGEPTTARRSVGHSHVLSPELRTPAGGALVARKLLEKAVERMRGMGYCARNLDIALRAPGGKRWHAHARVSPVQDTVSFFGLLDSLWDPPFGNPMQVSVTLGDLVKSEDVIPSLFDGEGERRVLSQVVDKINRQFGRDSIGLASVLPLRKAVEDKIAFGYVTSYQ